MQISKLQYPISKKKVESIVDQGKIAHPLIRETYELLIEQSKDTKKRGDELIYTKQLVWFVLIVSRTGMRCI